MAGEKVGVFRGLDINDIRMISVSWSPTFNVIAIFTQNNT